MAIERERKFLVKYLTFQMLNNNWSNIKQFYIIADMDKQLRIRIVDDNNLSKAFVTYKDYINTTDRNEFEYQINLNDAYDTLNNKNYISILEKKRLKYFGWEIDIYSDNLMVAEYEYSDENPFPKDLPDWIGNEITGNAYYSNINLAKKISED